MYRFLLIGIAALAALTLIYFSVLGFLSKSGIAPGLSADTLTPCPNKPNCVCSEKPQESSHYIKPLHYSGVSAEEAWTFLADTIEETGGKIIIARKTYLSATYSVSLFGFIDDVECRLDNVGQTIHIRSASRVGHSDLGVNRKRVAMITHLFNQKIK